MDEPDSLVIDEDSHTSSAVTNHDVHNDGGADDDSDDLQFVDDLNDESDAADRVTSAADECRSSSKISSNSDLSSEQVLTNSASTAELTNQLLVSSTGNSVEQLRVDASEQSMPSSAKPSSNSQLKMDTAQASAEDQVLTQTVPVSRQNSSDNDAGGQNKTDQTASNDKPTSVGPIIKHFIDGLIIEESTEPFPVCVTNHSSANMFYFFLHYVSALSLGTGTL